MQKQTVARLGGFLAAAGVTAGLVAAGVSLTGANFQDTEAGQVLAGTGEVDAVVDELTPLTQPFGPLMPDGPADTNTYTVTNVGTGPVDYYLVSSAWEAFDGIRADVANPGTSFENGTVRLDTTPADVAATSYEWSNLTQQVGPGDVLSFEYHGDCGAGAPRLFVRGGGAGNNTFDGNPDQCGTPVGGGWNLVTFELAPGFTAGPAGYTGIVNDVDNRVVHFRNVRIGEHTLVGQEFNICGGATDPVNVQIAGPSHDTGELDLCALPPAGLPALATNVAPGAAVNLSVSLSLDLEADNTWANTVGTSTLTLVAVQAGTSPSLQPDQATNDA